MKPPIVDYRCPGTVSEAVGLLGEYGDDAKILAGGQSLMPLLNMRFVYPTMLIDVNRLDEIGSIKPRDDRLVIGAMVRQGDAERSPVVHAGAPLLAAALPHVGHFVTRNRGTVGGSVVHADSRSEIPVVMAALGGAAVVVSTSGKRTIAAADLFLTHYTTSIAEDELLLETRWPLPRGSWGYAFREFSMRHGDYALGMVACAVRRDTGVVAEASVVVGAVADRPLVLDDVGAALVGERVDEETAAEAGHLAAANVDPPSDLHASARYRRHLVGLLTERAVLAAWSDAAEGPS